MRITIPIEYYYLSVVIAFIISLGLLRKKTPRHLMLFSVFLFTTIVAELLAWFVIQKRITTHPIYNIFVPIEFLFYTYFFYHELKSLVMKQAISIFWVLFSLFAVFNILFYQGFYS